MNHNITSDFFTALMLVTARRIARLNAVDTDEAAADYQQAVSAMTADERAEFDREIVRYAILEG